MVVGEALPWKRPDQEEVAEAEVLLSFDLAWEGEASRLDLEVVEEAQEVAEALRSEEGPIDQECLVEVGEGVAGEVVLRQTRLVYLHFEKQVVGAAPFSLSSFQQPASSLRPTSVERE